MLRILKGIFVSDLQRMMDAPCDGEMLFDKLESLAGSAESLCILDDMPKVVDVFVVAINSVVIVDPNVEQEEEEEDDEKRIVGDD